MRNSEGKSYAPNQYRTGTAQKRRREAAERVKDRRTSRRKAKQQLYQ